MRDPFLPFEATIKWIKKETRDTSTYAISIKDREIKRSYSFIPGQFNMIYIPGIGESPISISSAPHDHDLTHTIRIAGDVTTAIGRLNHGDSLYLRGPFGRGWPVEEAEEREVMIIGGGLGIAPLRSVIRELVKSRRKRVESKRGRILYGAKSPKDIIFRDEFPRYREAFDIYLTVDKADPEEYWRGETGFVTNLIGRMSFDPLNTVVFICGPEAMMQAVIRELILKGVPGEKIFLSMERNMNCGVGICGHCMFGPQFVCKDGPVFRFTDIEEFLGIKEI
ncbi:MAG: FAD/NAD(P)-binding protein [Thermodesulfovibrionales bacterium]